MKEPHHESDDVAGDLAESLAASADDIRIARIVRVDDAAAWLDIGEKFEAMLPLADWADPVALPRVGDRVVVQIVDDLAVDNRPLRVIRLEAHIIPANPGRKFFAKASPGDIHVGRITRKIKDGFLVDIGVNAFLPDEAATEAMRADVQACIGQSGSWRITRIDRDQLCIYIAPA